MVRKKYKMNDTLEDMVTGFKGVVLGITEHATGCIHYGLQPPMDKDGKVPDYEWFDQSRLKMVKTSKKSKGKPTGGPAQECPSRG